MRIEPRRPDEIKKAFLRALAWRRGWRGKIVVSNEHVCLFPEIGILLNRVKKSGNTTVSAFLSEIASTGLDTSSLAFKGALLTPPKMPYRTLLDLERFYSIVVVRNPYARALSTFRHKVEPGRSRSMTTMPGYGVVGREGFVLYLRALADGRLHCDRHLYPQVELMYKPAAAFSRVVKLERLAVEMASVLADNGLDPALAARLDAPHPVERNLRKITRSADKLARYYDDEAKALVETLYAADFDALGYPRTLPMA